MAGTGGTRKLIFADSFQPFHTLLVLSLALVPPPPACFVCTVCNSFGVVVWDVICGAGETPWAGTSISDLPLALKMGKRLAIPDECGRFYR